MATETPPSRPPAPILTPMRMAILSLALLLVLGAAYEVVSHWRRYQLWATGSVPAEGANFALHANDSWLSHWVLTTGKYEPVETNLMRSILKPGDVFIDVGANIGWYSVLGGKAVGPTGKVVAFEPEPGNIALLNKNVKLNGLTNVEVVGMGLSNAEGSFKLYLEGNNLGMHSLVMEHGGKQFINVKTVKFDDFWADRGPIKLIKIDTEGAEGMILDGMRKTLAKDKGVELIVEYAPERLKKSGYDAEKILTEMYELGFKAGIIDEESGRVLPLGTPTPKELLKHMPHYFTNLHLKR